MRRSWRDGIARGALVLTALALTAGALAGQSREEQAYLRSAANHFHMGEGEVVVLSEGGAAPEEIPVVLYIATRAGVSAEAILALRRSGRSWSDLLRRYGLHAGQLHLILDAVPSEGPLRLAYAAFAERPRNAWSVITLPDDALVALVNLNFLVEYLELPPDRVAQALAQADSPVAAYRALLSRRMS
ncbi:MAG TPA: hypothetical protein VLA43_19530 [Longimicrobiales bacterium]|nr:hypothetical protein [Longimicrobiales bacterium]